MPPEDPLGEHGPRLDEFLIERRWGPPTPDLADRWATFIIYINFGILAK